LGNNNDCEKPPKTCKPNLVCTTRFWENPHWVRSSVVVIMHMR